MPDPPRRRLLDRVAGAATVIGEGTHFEGMIRTVGSVLASGTVEGDGEVGGSLAIGNEAQWLGNVRAAEAVVAGRVIGDLTIEGKLEIGKNAVVHGNVRARFVAIAHGAV